MAPFSPPVTARFSVLIRSRAIHSGTIRSKALAWGWPPLRPATRRCWRRNTAAMNRRRQRPRQPPACSSWLSHGAREQADAAPDGEAGRLLSIILISGQRPVIGVVLLP